MDTKEFQRLVYAFYRKKGRHDLPWRTPALRLRGKDRELDPYKIAVSEVMLQQTQVPRVIEKYKQFIKRFPTVESLAAAPLAEVLALWSGLGYNRRAKFLKQMAVVVAATHKGTFPKTKHELMKLPGIGEYTASAIAAFAFNQPEVCIETNIRTVFINHFYKRRKEVSDAAIALLVAKTLDTKHPREWYWALMDYGSSLKLEGNVLHRNSKHYVKQGAFKGSRREVRGAILRALIARPQTLAELSVVTAKEQAMLSSVLGDLANERLVKKEKGHFMLET